MRARRHCARRHCARRHCARRHCIAAAALGALALGPGPADAQPPAPATVASPQPPPPASPERPRTLAVVHGVVSDSLAGGPLAAAAVQVVRVGDRHGGRGAETDAAGRFRIDALAPGRYLVGFSHPLLDLLRLEVRPRVLDLGAGADSVRVDLAVPALAGVRAAVCGSEQAPTDSSGLLAGRVRDAANNAPVANATVALTWTELSVGAGGVRTEHRRVPAATGPGGEYVICGVPADVELVVSAAAPGRASGEVGLAVPSRGFMRRDLGLGDSASVAAGAAPATSVAAPIARGTARLTGTVRDAAGRPVRGARAAVRGAAAAATTAGDGAFTLGGLPAGTHTLEVRAIGFTPRRVPVDLAAGRTRTLDVEIGAAVAALDPVTVYGTPAPPSPLLRDFLARQRRGGLGRFVTAADLARMKPFEVTGALRGMAGLQLVPNGRLGTAILGRGKFGGVCPAAVLLDGQPLPPGDDLDAHVGPERVAGIEVYPDATFAPPEYGGPARGNCSVVLVWTRR